MGYLKDIHSNLDIQAFPGAHFEIAGDVPVAQCSEAKIEGFGDTEDAPQFRLNTILNYFAGYDLTGKICTIFASVAGNIGDFDITSNLTSRLFLQQDPGNSSRADFYIHDGGSLILTRNVKSFAEFIHAAGYAYTIKGGKLYTNMPSAELKDACTILFDPLT